MICATTVSCPFFKTGFQLSWWFYCMGNKVIEYAKKTKTMQQFSLERDERKNEFLTSLELPTNW